MLMLRKYDLFDGYSLNDELDKFIIEDIESKMDVLKKWERNIERYKGKNEKQLQPLFFNQIFVELLGYENMSTGESEWSIQFEESTEIDSSVPDGILGIYSNEREQTKAVIELKALDVRDLDKKQKRANKNYGSPVDQGYSYANKYDGCEWIIVSNMLEIRLYKNGQSQHYYEQFFIPELAKNVAEFTRFYYLLRKEGLVEKNKVLEINRQSVYKKSKITQDFYNFYSQARELLWESLQKNNPSIDSHDLLEKTQKILNRITFILFSEANNLIPSGTLEKFYEQGKSNELLSNWVFLHTLFEYINEGKENQNINKFNGGLFKADRILDRIDIPDNDFKIIEGFFKYDFKEGLTVDVLGHIFEQSISDIERLKGAETEVGNRKEHGIFYTPEYVTDYIVRESIDQWLEQEKEKLGFNNLKHWTSTEDKSWQTRYIQENIDLLNKLKESLSNIKILDPTCGSGAFLTKVFECLHRKHNEIFKDIMELEALKTNQPSSISDEYMLDMDRDILINNIFGIDLNKESVEITKLALWLQTANKHKPLTTLDENIITGNTVIDDEELACNRRVNWDLSFPGVKEKGGFDIILGNPPYIPIDYLDKETIAYYQETYGEILKSKWETSIIFMYKSAELLNKNGLISMIVPVTWLTGINYYNFRSEFLNKRIELTKLIVMPSDVFPDAYVDTCIVMGAHKSNEYTKDTFLGYKYPLKEKLSTISVADTLMDEIEHDEVLSHDFLKLFPNKKSYNLYRRIKEYLNDHEKFVKLGDVTDCTQGPVESKFSYSNLNQGEGYLPYLKKGQGFRYILNIEETNFINFKEKATLFKYYIDTPRLYARRIINRQDRLMFCYCDKDLVTKKELNPFIVTDERIDIKSLYAILNSKLISYIYINFSSAALKDDYRQTTLGDLNELPIKLLNVEQINELNAKVEQLETAIKNFRNKRKFNVNYIESLLNAKMSNKLLTYYKLTAAEFLKELKKANKTLSKEVLEELHQLHMDSAPDLKSLMSVVYEIDSSIEDYVYDIYEVPAQEREEINEYYSMFNNPSSLQLEI